MLLTIQIFGTLCVAFIFFKIGWHCRGYCDAKKAMGIKMHEEKSGSLIVHDKVTPCPMPRHNNSLVSMKFEYGDKHAI